VARLSILAADFASVPLAFHRDIKLEIVFGFPFGLAQPSSAESEIRSLLNSCESNRLPRPAVCWVANINSISKMQGNAAESEKLDYLARQYFNDKPSNLRIMVDPSLCTKEALLYYVRSNTDLFANGMGAMLTLGSLMGNREVTLKDLALFEDSDILVKVNRNIKTDKEFETWMNSGADYIGTPYLDRVLDGY
jgi:hypothetical protein